MNDEEMAWTGELGCDNPTSLPPGAGTRPVHFSARRRFGGLMNCIVVYLDPPGWDYSNERDKCL